MVVATAAGSIVSPSVDRGLENLQVLARQELPRAREVDGVSRQLHAVLRGAKRGGPDALARRQERKREPPRGEALADRVPEAAAEIAEIAFLASVDVFATPPENIAPAMPPTTPNGSVSHNPSTSGGAGSSRERRQERVGHPRRHAAEILLAHPVPKVPVATRERGEPLARRIEAREPALRVDDRETAAEMDRRRVHDRARLDQGELRGAAADVDVEKRRRAIVRDLGGAGAVGGEHRLHVMPGRRADELAAHLREHVGDRLGVLAAQRLAGEDHRAGVDMVGMHAGGLVGRVDDVPDRLIVDALLAEIRRQRDRRLVHGLPAHHEVAAGQLLREPPQVHAREHHLRAGGADIDADREERDVVLQPEAGRGRIVLAANIVVIVIVVRFPLLVRVHGVQAEEMILQAVRAFVFRGVGHRILVCPGVTAEPASLMNHPCYSAAPSCRGRARRGRPVRSCDPPPVRP